MAVGGVIITAGGLVTVWISVRTRVDQRAEVSSRRCGRDRERSHA